MPEETAKESKVFLGIYIPENLFVELKKKSAEDRSTMTKAVIELISEYVKK